MVCTIRVPCSMDWAKTVKIGSESRQTEYTVTVLMIYLIFFIFPGGGGAGM